MSPKAPDPQIRTALIEAAARLLVEHGPDALSTRRLASEVGASTMAVYTHFKGMDELRRAVAMEGFQRLSDYMDLVDKTDDPVADVATLGGVYFLNAIANSDLYRFMFSECDEDDEVGLSTFQRMIDAVAAAVRAGRFHGDPEKLATQLWASGPGIVMLHLAGALTLEEAMECFSAMGANMFVGFGDDRDAADHAVANAMERLGGQLLQPVSAAS